MAPRRTKGQISETSWLPSLHAGDNMQAIGIDATFYKQNVFHNPEDITAYENVLSAITARAPLIADEIRQKAPKGSPLQNMISDFDIRIGQRSQETHAHVSAVVEMTASCANHLVENKQLTPEQGADLCLGAIIHDFGKLYISKAILANKTAQLSPVRLKRMRSHIDYSAMIARQVLPEDSDISRVVSTHHERLDSSVIRKG